MVSAPAHYILGVIKAVASPLIAIAVQTLSHPCITHPEDNAIVPVGAVKVSGTYHRLCGLSFVLLHHYENKYWPQGGPVLDRTRHTWEKKVQINPPLAEKHSISIAAFTEDVRRT
jgi:hypothetical protein